MSGKRSISPRIAIVGAGFGGLCMAVNLRRAGFHDFFLLEREDAIGGTWRDNTYPGAACDIASFAYCFSFEPKHDWSRKWATQPEIRDYIHRLAISQKLLRHIRLGTELVSAEHRRGKWHLVLRSRTTGDETREVVDVLVTSVGQLNRPNIPAIPGRETFRGTQFHSARWDPAFDPTDRRVAMIGAGASAIQIVPELAPRARELILFQRTPSWILPKNDRTYGDLEHKVFGAFPITAKLYRYWLWLYYELHYPAIRGNAIASRYARYKAESHMRAQVVDRQLAEKLTPTYPVAAKRTLISDDYYPAVSRSNVKLVADAVVRIEADAVIDGSGARHEVDALVFATGFDTTSFLAPMRIVGREGRPLDDVWRDGAEAYLGMQVAGFPSFFMLYGPNTNLGHSSILFMLECQANYIVKCLEMARDRGTSWVEITQAAHRAYNDWIQQDLAKTVWAQVERSWYMTITGKITNNWPRTTTEYWLRTRRPNSAHLRFVREHERHD